MVAAFYGYGWRGSHLPRLRLRTGRATFTASWLLSQQALVIGTSCLVWNLFFRSPSDLTHKHDTTRCAESPALPENKALLLVVPSDFSILLAVFPPADSAHVSLSWALPQAFAFWAIFFLVALVDTYSYTKRVTTYAT